MRAGAQPAAAPLRTPMAAYPHDEIERRWQAWWAENGTFRAAGPGDEGFDASRPKFYVLDMFPYPSGAGLHVGHPEGYTATDITARYRRMRGFNVLHPMGWDAFGLPAEQYAVETGTHPRVTTEENIRRFREQLQRLGFSYDWDREVDTTDPAYYRWTQWIFLQLHERGLAYEAEVAVNWCPALGTVLANEEVIDGKSERGGFPVVQMPMRQWMLRITEYAERLLDGLDQLDWPESVKEMQRNWIGRSEGAQVDFRVVLSPDTVVRVFTTRPDTIFGATSLVLAPEHPLVGQLTTEDRASAVEDYVEKTRRKTDRDRQESRTKTGVFTGSHATNPASGESMPIWIADFVLGSYGTGAIMAVPGHDERDYEFAVRHGLPVREVVAGGTLDADGQLAGAYTGDGPHVNSDSTDRPIPLVAERGVSIDGLPNAEAIDAIIAWLEANGVGRRRVTFKLRDWLFSRQRYWGEPIPIVHVDGRPMPLPDDELPVVLPRVDTYQPTGTGESPLAGITEWVATTREGAPARRETNTMPQWAGSCWYFLRFVDPRNGERIFDPERERYWMPVDLYIGGAEHAVLHLLYARFWHMVLYDAGVVSTPEPFMRLINQGMILGEVEYTAYRHVSSEGDEFGYVSAEHAVEADSSDDDDAVPAFMDARDGEPLVAVRVPYEDVEKRGDGFVMRAHPDVRVAARAHKMSKSRGNVVNPDDIVDAYGADSLRLYEMFMGPLEATKPWSTRSVEGVHRFLARAYRLLISGDHAPALTADEPDREQLQVLHATIKRVTEDIDDLRFNTAISAMMEFLNAAYKWPSVPRSIAEPFVLLLAPFAPHLAEEAWRELGHSESLAYEGWPEHEESYLETDTLEIAVQVNGKLRGSITVPAGAAREELLAAARGHENVSRYLNGGATVRKEVVVPGRLVNFVVG